MLVDLDLKEALVKLVNLAEMVLMDFPEVMDEPVAEENPAVLEPLANKDLLDLLEHPEVVVPPVHPELKELHPTEKMDPLVTKVKLEPLDDPELKEIVEPLDELERLDLPEELESEDPQVVLDPLVLELPVVKEKLDAQVVLDVKEKVVFSVDLVTLD